MKVLFITGSFPPLKCGIGDYTALLVSALARSNGVAVGVLTSRGAVCPAEANGVELLPLLDNWEMGSLPILRIISKWQPDIVHIQYPTKGYGRGKMPLLLPLLLALHGFSVVQTWHEPLSLMRGLRYLPCALMRDSFVTVEPDYKPLVPAFIWRLLQQKRRGRYIPVGAMIPTVRLTAAEKAALKHEFAADSSNLVAYFGFAIPSKGVEALFEIADPAVDRLVLVCELDPADEYHRRITSLMEDRRWQGKAFTTGYLPGEDAARVLAAADVALFPFVAGMTRRNTSVYAAQAQGTFVLTTNVEKQGYSESENIYYALPGDLEGLRTALRRYCGQRGGRAATADWAAIAAAHLDLYREIMTENSQGD